MMRHMGKTWMHTMVFYRHLLEAKEGDSFVIMTPDGWREIAVTKVRGYEPARGPAFYYDDVPGSQQEGA